MVNIGVILIKSVRLFPVKACSRGGYIEKDEDDDSKPKEGNGNGNGNEGGNGNGGSVSEGNKSGDNSLRDWFGKESLLIAPLVIGFNWAVNTQEVLRQTSFRTNHKPKCGSSKMKRNLSKDEEEARSAEKK